MTGKPIPHRDLSKNVFLDPICDPVRDPILFDPDFVEADPEHATCAKQWIN